MHGLYIIQSPVVPEPTIFDISNVVPSSTFNITLSTKISGWKQINKMLIFPDSNGSNEISEEDELSIGETRGWF